MNNHTIRELVNQDYSNDKERALCEFILQMQDELDSIKNSVIQIQEIEPNYFPVELIIDDLPFVVSDSNIGDKTLEKLQQLQANSITFSKEHRRATDAGVELLDQVGEAISLFDYNV